MECFVADAPIGCHSRYAMLNETEPLHEFHKDEDVFTLYST